MQDDRPSTAPPPWTASWCWTRKHLSRPWNYYAFFRKTLDLPDKPSTAAIRISADARYALYVNAVRVHQGPARSFPEHQSYDTIDLAPLLRAGVNTVCAIVHQFGVPTFFSQYRDLSGFLVDGAAEVDGVRHSLDTPDGWTCRPAQGWRRDVARLSVQMGFQEHFDADADPRDWMLPSFEPREADGWKTPWLVGPVGCHPWLELEERGIPLLAAHVEPFTAVVAQFSGENARGCKIADDVYHFPLREERRRERVLLEHPAAMLRDDDESTVVVPGEDAHFAMAVLDLGQYRSGHIMLDIEDAAGDEIIDIIYSEELDKNQGPLIVGGPDNPTHCEEATADRYRCRPGAQQWEAFHFKGMRYATLIFRNVEKPLKIRRVALRQVHAAVPDAGSFECSDARLNKIWKVGRETQRNCLFDAFVDCPWREQAQWWGDARVQGRVTAYAFGDSSVLARGIRQVAQSMAPDGALHAHPPADSPCHYLPDFMMTWIGTLWDHYAHTGSTALVRECLPALHGVLQFLHRHEMFEGLLGEFPGFWVFLDWQKLDKSGCGAVLNMMYLAALRWAADLCELVDDAGGARTYRQRAVDLERSIEKRFWDDSARIWRDGYDPRTNARFEETSQHANALAILLNLKPKTHAALARDVLLKAAKGKRHKILTASPFFYAYVLEAMAQAGLRDEMVQVMRDKWGTFLDKGATTFWEMWDVTIGSFCHAWSASPVYHLSQQVLGVTPVRPGWKQVRIAPTLAGLDFARGVVPSPLGPIRVEWEKAAEDQLAVRVDLPEGMQAEFISPLGDRRGLGAGSHEFQA